MVDALAEKIAWGIVQQNVKNFPDISRAQFNWIVGRLAAEGGWIGLNEVDGPGDDEALDRILNPRDWYLWPGGENNIAVKQSRWRPAPYARIEAAAETVGISTLPESFERAGTLELHEGNSGISPARDIKWVTLQFLENPLFTPCVFACWHRATDPKPEQSKTDREWLTRMNALAYTRVSRKVASWNNLGLPVVWVGDTNDTTTPLFHPREKRLITDKNAIDHIGYISSATQNWNLQLLGQEKIPNKVEPGHPMRVSNVQAVANARYFEQVKTNLSLTEQVENWIAKWNPERVARTELLNIVKGK